MPTPSIPSPTPHLRPLTSRQSLEQHRLANGLRVVLARDDSLPLVAVNLWYHVGSKNEHPGHTGFAHLFEHMLFQGSQNVGTNDHFARIQQVGGVANGSTSRDRTNYYETLPAHHLDLGLWLESDRMGFLLPAMTPEKLETQRQVVMNERLQRVDNQPYGRAMERLHELLFPDTHPYSWPVIGYMDDIARATLEEVRTFFTTYYRPNNAVLTLAGDFDPDAALKSVETYFGPIPSGPEPPPVLVPPIPVRGRVAETIEDDVRLPRVYVACPMPPFGSDDWYAADLLSTLLGMGKASPLYRDLVHERQMAQGVTSYLAENELAGVFLLMATARPGVDPKDLAAALERHIDRAIEEPFPEADVERARNQVLTAFYDDLQRLDRRADLISQATTYFYDPDRADTRIEPYLRLTADEIAECARRHLGEDHRVVLTVAPKGEA